MSRVTLFRRNIQILRRLHRKFRSSKAWDGPCARCKLFCVLNDSLLAGALCLSWTTSATHHTDTRNKCPLRLTKDFLGNPTIGTSNNRNSFLDLVAFVNFFRPPCQGQERPVSRSKIPHPMRLRRLNSNALSGPVPFRNYHIVRPHQREVVEPSISWRHLLQWIGL
jgi:hypothetical protein